MKSVVIYLGGNGPSDFPGTIDRSNIVKVIAADSGIELAQQHEIHVDILIGDMDSASVESIETAENNGTEIIRFDSEKNYTDFELALAEATNIDADQLIIIGGGGKRSDHLLGNISVITGEQTNNYLVDIYFETEKLFVCRANQPRELKTNFDDLISLIPIHGNVYGVTTNNLKWELTNADLDSSNALGISNSATNKQVSVSTTNGSLLIIQQNEYSN